MAENLGTLNFDVTVTDKTDDVLKNLKKTIDDITKDGVKLTVSGNAKAEIESIRKEIESLQRAATNISINAQGLENIRISSFNVDQSAVDGLARRIADSISAEPVKLKNVDTSELRAELTKAIEKSVSDSKGSLMKRMQEALSSGAKGIKINVNAKSIIDNVEKALNSRNIKVSGVSVNKADLAANIREALKGQEFYIKIKIDKQSVNEALNLGSASNSASNGLSNAAGSAEKFHGKLRPLSDQMKTTTQLATVLGNSLGNLFSTYMVKNFLEGVVQIGGELEKQRLAMSAIIGDAEKANRIFAQVSQLSMISPFDVQDLITYTKQLSAFGIQYDKLYDTTKRLSDLAAGVGVSFGRIAYEFGQTSARGWLDGRELRMFANSGIPLLQKLSDLYTRLRGEVVTASQVREMVTNRQVSFEDVETVIKEMTDAGGEFYQMQEVMAESLSAKWRNLANDWNLMLGNITDSAVGNALKWVAEVLMTVVENWQKVAWAAGAFIALRAPLAMMNALVLSGSKATKEAVTWTNQWGLAWQGMKKSSANVLNMIKSNIFNITGLLVGAAAGLIAYFYEMRKEEAEYRNMINGIDSAINAQTSVAVASLDRLIYKLGEAKDNQQEYTKLVSQLRNKYGDYFDTLDEEASKYEEIKKQAGAAAEKIREKIKEQRVADAEQQVSDRFQKVTKSFRETVETQLGFIKDKNLITNMTDDIIDMIEGGLTNSEIVDKLNAIYKDFLNGRKISVSSYLFGGLLDSGNSPIDAYRKDLQQMNEDIKNIEKNASHVPYERIIQPINEFFDALARNTDNANENLNIERDRLQAIIDVLTKGQAVVSDGTIFNGEPFGDAAAKRFKDQLKEIELQISREWVRISNGTLDSIEFGDVSKRTIKSDVGVGKEDTDYLKYVEKLIKKRKELDESLKKRDNIQNGKSGDADIYRYKYEAAELDAINKVLQALGVNIEAFEKKRASSSSKDAVLEGWQEEARLIHEAYQEYKKFYDLYQDSEVAKGKVKENPLFANLDVDPSAIYDNYTKLIERVKAEMGKDPRRQKFEIQLEGQRFQIKFDLDKDSYEKSVALITSGMQRAITDNKDKFDFFKQMYDATGASQYRGTFASFLEKEIRDRLNVGADFDISQLIDMDKDSLRGFVDDAKAIDAVVLALNEYKNTLKAVESERRNAVLSGTKYMQSYKDELVALNERFSNMMGVSIEAGSTALIELPKNATEEVKCLYGEYLKLFAAIEKRSLNGMPWLTNLMEQIRKSRNGGGNKQELAAAQGATFTQAVNDTTQILNNIAGSSDAMKELTENAIEAMNTIANIVSQLSSGNYIGAAVSFIAIAAKTIAEGGRTAREERERKRTEVNLSNQISLLSSTIERLADAMEKAATVQERNDAYRQQLVKMNEQMNAYVAQFNKAMTSTASGILFAPAYASAITGKKATDYQDGYTYEEIMEIVNKATEEQLAVLLGKSKDPTKTKDLIDAIMDLKDAEKELEEKLNKENLGFDFSDLKSNFVDTLMDMDSSSQDFWDKFAEYGVKAGLNEFIGKNIQSDLERIYNEFSKDFSADGIVSQSAINGWRSQVEALYEKSQQQAEYLNQIWGRGMDEDDNLKSSIKGMTEDTAEIIAAYLNTITANTAIIRAAEESVAYVQLPMLQITADSQLTQLEIQTDHLAAIRESNEIIADRIQNLDDNFSATLDGNKRVAMQ